MIKPDVQTAPSLGVKLFVDVLFLASATWFLSYWAGERFAHTALLTVGCALFYVSIKPWR